MKFFIITNLFTFLTIAFFSCASSKSLENAVVPLIELQTSGCRGFCPIYRLSFKKDGTAEYEGIRFVEKMGVVAFKINNADISALRKNVKEANLWQYPDRIESKVMDASSATLTVYNGTKTKSVVGTIDRPKELLSLEEQMKALAVKAGINLKGIDPNAPKEATKAEVILKLKDDVNAGNWMRQFGELRLKLVRRTPPGNTWLVSYDMEQIKEKDLIDLFKGTEGCLEAQGNAKATDRN
jgi:hypothetical protein